MEAIDEAIAPFDIAGLGDPSRRDWYPALASDILGNARKLDSTVDDVRAMLARCGFPSV